MMNRTPRHYRDGLTVTRFAILVIAAGFAEISAQLTGIAVPGQLGSLARVLVGLVGGAWVGIAASRWGRGS